MSQARLASGVSWRVLRLGDGGGGRGGASGTRPPAPDPAPPERTNSPSSDQGCGLFPADHVWNVAVDALPVDFDSDAYVESIGPGEALHPDFGPGQWDGGPIGIPYIEVDTATPRVPV